MRERERESEVLLCSVVACAYNNKIRVDDEIRREDEKQKTEYSVGKENGPTTQTLYLSLSIVSRLVSFLAPTLRLIYHYDTPLYLQI